MSSFSSLSGLNLLDSGSSDETVDEGESGVDLSTGFDAGSTDDADLRAPSPSGTSVSPESVGGSLPEIQDFNIEDFGFESGGVDEGEAGVDLSTGFQPGPDADVGLSVSQATALPELPGVGDLTPEGLEASDPAEELAQEEELREQRSEQREAGNELQALSTGVQLRAEQVFDPAAGPNIQESAQRGLVRALRTPTTTGAATGVDDATAERQEAFGGGFTDPVTEEQREAAAETVQSATLGTRQGLAGIRQSIPTDNPAGVFAEKTVAGASGLFDVFLYEPATIGVEAVTGVDPSGGAEVGIPSVISAPLGAATYSIQTGDLTWLANSEQRRRVLAAASQPIEATPGEVGGDTESRPGTLEIVGDLAPIVALGGISRAVSRVGSADEVAGRAEDVEETISRAGEEATQASTGGTQQMSILDEAVRVGRLSSRNIDESLQGAGSVDETLETTGAFDDAVQTLDSQPALPAGGSPLDGLFGVTDDTVRTSDSALAVSDEGTLAAADEAVGGTEGVLDEISRTLGPGEDPLRVPSTLDEVGSTFDDAVTGADDGGRIDEAFQTSDEVAQSEAAVGATDEAVADAFRGFGDTVDETVSGAADEVGGVTDDLTAGVDDVRAGEFRAARTADDAVRTADAAEDGTALDETVQTGEEAVSAAGRGGDKPGWSKVTHRLLLLSLGGRVARRVSVSLFRCRHRPSLRAVRRRAGRVVEAFSRIGGGVPSLVDALRSSPLSPLLSSRLASDLTETKRF